MSKRFFVQFLLFMSLVFASAVVSLPVYGQDAAKGYLGRGKDQYRIFSFGDGLAGGLWAGMARLTKGDMRFSLNGRYRDGSGLARFQVYNWPVRLASIVEKRRMDIALVLVGTNDARSIRLPGELLTFGSKEWKDRYALAVRSMMQQLKSRGIAVYWMEIPPVANPELDKKLKKVAAIQRREAANAGIRFVETRKVFTDATGTYIGKGPGVHGKIVRYRERNGIRFLKNGNDRLARIVLDAIMLDIEIADGVRTSAEFPNPSGAKVAENAKNTPYVGPVFSMPSSDDASIVFQPKNVPARAAIQVAKTVSGQPKFSAGNGQKVIVVGVSGGSAMAQLRSGAKPGSVAANLFETGTWPKDQPGRVGSFLMHNR